MIINHINNDNIKPPSKKATKEKGQPRKQKIKKGDQEKCNQGKRQPRKIQEKCDFRQSTPVFDCCRET